MIYREHGVAININRDFNILRQPVFVLFLTAVFFGPESSSPRSRLGDESRERDCAAVLAWGSTAADSMFWEKGSDQVA